MRLCIYGAGKVGKAFLQKEHNICASYSEVFFVDANPDLWDARLYGISVKNIDYIDMSTEVIIASSLYWQEIYQICHANKFRVRGIFDIDTEQVYSYKEMCRLKKTVYMNGKYIEYCQDKKTKIDMGVLRFLQTGELFENIHEVAIMLSNLCNYAGVHKECPASCVKQKEILASETVFKVVDELASIQFAGTVCFHVYNEPLIDPRLFWFIEYVKRVLPASLVEVYSNGYYLNTQMVIELQEIGADILVVTGYGEAEYNRLIDMDVDMAYYVLFGNLDERLEHYIERKEPVLSDICRTYLTQVPIFSNGDIGVCCLDYLHQYGLGNICHKSLRDILNSEHIVTLQRELLHGNRSMYALCKNCTWNTR